MLCAAEFAPKDGLVDYAKTSALKNADAQQRAKWRTERADEVCLAACSSRRRRRKSAADPKVVQKQLVILEGDSDVEDEGGEEESDEDDEPRPPSYKSSDKESKLDPQKMKSKK